MQVQVSSKNPWVEGESEVGYAYDELDNSFDLPIERLMLEVLTLVLDAGRGSERAKAYHRMAIAEIFSNNDLSELLENIPPGEAEELNSDIKILGIF